MSTGAELIAAERQRQIDIEGYSAAHDAEHDDGSLVRAARCYIDFRGFAARIGTGPITPPVEWPWRASDWKPHHGDPVRDLVIAGALIAAEIDRITATEVDRAAILATGTETKHG